MSRTATSVLLQGLPKQATKIIFLFPDGAGSASAYAKIPKINPAVALYGLNCPFVRHPEDMSTYTLEQLTALYVTEIRRRQPDGPYYLGGWSAGGSLAFRAASELIMEGEEVAALILLDSPDPDKLGKLPQRFLNHIRDAGVFGSKPNGEPLEIPKTVLPHFNGTMDVMEGYRPKPLPEGASPKTSIIYATESALQGDHAYEAEESDPDDMKFLTEKRKDFGAAGWARLVPGVQVSVEKAVGAHHFSLMSDPEQLKTVATFIDRAIATDS